MYPYFIEETSQAGTARANEAVTKRDLKQGTPCFDRLGENLNLRCAIYARSAVANIENLSVQIKLCSEKARAEGWIVLDSYVKSDCGVSGLYWAGLGGLEALLIAAETESRPFDCLLVTDSTRLSRNNDVARKIIKAFAFYGVPIFSVQDSEVIDESLRHLADFHIAFSERSEVDVPKTDSDGIGT